jgi:histidyl-tRNA synthetase
MKPQVLKGFRDYLPVDMLARQALVSRIRRVFESFGFAPIETPALEYAELLLGKYGDEGDKLLFRFLDNGERDVALRYDLTVPLARMLGANPEIIPPFKRYHVAPVWRAEKPARGRFREFMQCDVDIVGVAEMTADAEVISTGMSALEEVLKGHAPGYTLRLSNRKLLNGLCAKLGIDDKAAVHVFRSIDKLDKQPKDTVRTLLLQVLSEAQADAVFAYLECPATPTDLSALERFFEGIEVAALGIAEVKEVVSLITAHGLGHRLAIDLSIARGLDYYTGSIYETSLNGLDGFGSVMSGGRYDKLLDMFTGKPTPAVGISVGLDRLLAGLMELRVLTSRETPTRALVTVFSPETRLYAMQVAKTLRGAGLCTEIYLPNDKLGKQFRYADRRKIPFVLIAGPDEAQKNVVKLKTLGTGEERELPLAALPEWAQTESQNA